MCAMPTPVNFWKTFIILMLFPGSHSFMEAMEIIQISFFKPA